MDAAVDVLFYWAAADDLGWRFLLGPLGADGTDRYVLGDINVSSVFPIPEEAPSEIAGRADRLPSKLDNGGRAA